MDFSMSYSFNILSKCIEFSFWFHNFHIIHPSVIFFNIFSLRRGTIAFTMDQVGKVREATDIVALISSYISLKKAGANFKSQCPFHSEKSPSFVVSPERQIWHCFGCQKGGDAFTFLMEYEHIEFPEALRILADKAGIALEHQKYDSGLSSKKETIYKINRLAAEFYHYVLTKHTVGKDALNYVQNTRHVKPATMKTILIVYAPT